MEMALTQMWHTWVTYLTVMDGHMVGITSPLVLGGSLSANGMSSPLGPDAATA